MGTGTVTWDSSYTYILKGFVFVNAGDELTILPGTVIKGAFGQGENAAALIVTRGATIMAEGTENNPIIFTSEADQLNNNIPVQARGLWGGVIILGSAPLNSSPGETSIDGIPTLEKRGLYGGNNTNDNSGVFKYVSIRHGGSDIGAGNEINGLTLGGVGAATTFDYIEVIANADDGLECFGGAAQLKHLIISYCGDDFIDYDEGFSGKIQFALVYQDPNDGDRIGEHDGGTTPEDGNPFAKPHFVNMTYIGRGLNGGKRLITFRDNAGGYYDNSIFMNQSEGIDIENLSSGEDSFKRFQSNELMLSNNVFFDVKKPGTTAQASDLFTISMGSGWSSVSDSLAEVNNSTTSFVAAFNASNNTVADPGITINPLNPVPTNSSSVINGAPVTDLWFDAVSYQGAFDPNLSNWAGWSRLFN